MAALDKYSLTVVQVMGTRSIANTFHINVVDDSGAVDEYTAVNDAFEAEFIPLMQAMQTDEVEYECNLVAKMDPMSEPSQVFPLTSSGDLPSEAYPSNQAANINHVSSDGRPPFRGRWFIAGVPESFGLNGRWIAGLNAIVTSFLDAVPLVYGSAGLQYQLQHYSRSQETYFDIKRAWLNAVPTKLRNRTPRKCSIL